MLTPKFLPRIRHACCTIIVLGVGPRTYGQRLNFWRQITPEYTPSVSSFNRAKRVAKDFEEVWNIAPNGQPARCMGILRFGGPAYLNKLLLWHNGYAFDIALPNFEITSVRRTTDAAGTSQAPPVHFSLKQQAEAFVYPRIRKLLNWNFEPILDWNISEMVGGNQSEVYKLTYSSHPYGRIQFYALNRCSVDINADGKLQSFRQLSKLEIESNEQVISRDEARILATQYSFIHSLDAGSVIKVELGYVWPMGNLGSVRSYWPDKRYKSRLGYRVEFSKNQIVVMIDAATGESLGGTYNWEANHSN